MLTAITTILGLVPMAIGLSIDFLSFKAMMGTQSGAWWGPMAVAVIFGLAFATLYARARKDDEFRFDAHAVLPPQQAVLRIDLQSRSVHQRLLAIRGRRHH